MEECKICGVHNYKASEYFEYILLLRKNGPKQRFN